MREEVTRATDRPNILVVSVRLSQKDVARLQELSEEFGVGVSTYIRILVRDHLASRGDASVPFGDRTFGEEVAASNER